jgi:DNA-binding Lrp family transcriptional regulator
MSTERRQIAGLNGNERRLVGELPETSTKLGEKFGLTQSGVRNRIQRIRQKGIKIEYNHSTKEFVAPEIDRDPVMALWLKNEQRLEYEPRFSIYSRGYESQINIPTGVVRDFLENTDYVVLLHDDKKETLAIKKSEDVENAYKVTERSSDFTINCVSFLREMGIDLVKIDKKRGSLTLDAEWDPENEAIKATIPPGYKVSTD